MTPLKIKMSRFEPCAMFTTLLLSASIPAPNVSRDGFLGSGEVARSVSAPLPKMVVQTTAVRLTKRMEKGDSSSSADSKSMKEEEEAEKYVSTHFWGPHKYSDAFYHAYKNANQKLLRNQYFARKAVEQRGWVIKCVDEKIADYYELANIALDQTGDNMRYVKRDYGKCSQKAMLTTRKMHEKQLCRNKEKSECKFDPDCEWVTKYHELEKAMVYRDGSKIVFVDSSTDLEAYERLAIIATNNGYFSWVDKDRFENKMEYTKDDGWQIVEKNAYGKQRYFELAKIEVQRTGQLPLQWIKRWISDGFPEHESILLGKTDFNVEQYKEIVKIAIERYPPSIESHFEEIKDDANVIQKALDNMPTSEGNLKKKLTDHLRQLNTSNADSPKDPSKVVDSLEMDEHLHQAQEDAPADSTSVKEEDKNSLEQSKSTVEAHEEDVASDSDGQELENEDNAANEEKLQEDNSEDKNPEEFVRKDDSKKDHLEEERSRELQKPTNNDALKDEENSEVNSVKKKNSDDKEKLVLEEKISDAKNQETNSAEADEKDFSTEKQKYDPDSKRSQKDSLPEANDSDTSSGNEHHFVAQPNKDLNQPRKNKVQQEQKLAVEHNKTVSIGNLSSNSDTSQGSYSNPNDGAERGVDSQQQLGGGVTEDKTSPVDQEHNPAMENDSNPVEDRNSPMQNVDQDPEKNLQSQNKAQNNSEEKEGAFSAEDSTQNDKSPEELTSSAKEEDFSPASNLPSNQDSNVDQANQVQKLPKQEDVTKSVEEDNWEEKNPEEKSVLEEKSGDAQILSVEDNPEKQDDLEKDNAVLPMDPSEDDDSFQEKKNSDDSQESSQDASAFVEEEKKSPENANPKNIVGSPNSLDEHHNEGVQILSSNALTEEEDNNDQLSSSNNQQEINIDEQNNDEKNIDPQDNDDLDGDKVEKNTDEDTGNEGNVKIDIPHVPEQNEDQAHEPIPLPLPAKENKVQQEQQQAVGVNKLVSTVNDDDSDSSKHVDAADEDAPTRQDIAQDDQKGLQKKDSQLQDQANQVQKVLEQEDVEDDNLEDKNPEEKSVLKKNSEGAQILSVEDNSEDQGNLEYGQNSEEQTNSDQNSGEEEDEEKSQEEEKEDKLTEQENSSDVENHQESKDQQSDGDVQEEEQNSEVRRKNDKSSAEQKLTKNSSGSQKDLKKKLVCVFVGAIIAIVMVWYIVSRNSSSSSSA